MNARPAVKPILIANRMKHWLRVARQPFLDPKYQRSRVLYNYRRLVKKYPEIAKAHGLDEGTIHREDFVEGI
jgi:hypothetical protein